MLPAGAALERILERTGYLALAATTTGCVEAGDLLHAIDRVRQVAEGGQSLAAAAAALEEDREAASEVESLPLEPGQSDVVRVMNLHKAKGLEAPVVFLADPCGGFKPRVDVRIIRDGLVASGYFSITTEFGRSEKVLAQPAGWDQLKQDEQAYLVAEESRLLYVAATRARDLLVVGRWANNSGGGVRAWEAFAPFLGGLPELPVPATVSAPAAQPADLSAAANAQASAMRDAAHIQARMPSWSATSVTAEARHIAKIARSEEADPDDPTRVVVPDTPSHRADAGMAWGTLIHGLLEHAMRHKTATRDDLRRLAMWLTVEEPQLRVVIDEALDTVETVAQADFWAKARASEHQEEVPFCVGAPTPGGTPGLTSGIVDLVHRVDGPLEHHRLQDGSRRRLYDDQIRRAAESLPRDVGEDDRWRRAIGIDQHESDAALMTASTRLASALVRSRVIDAARLPVTSGTVRHVLEQKPLLAGGFAQAVIECHEGQSRRAAFGRDQGRGQLQGIGGAQGVHTQEPPRRLADLVAGINLHPTRGEGVEPRERLGRIRR